MYVRVYITNNVTRNMYMHMHACVENTYTKHAENIIQLNYTYHP